MEPHIVFVDSETRKSPLALHENKEIAWELARQGKAGLSAIVVLDGRDNWPYLYDDSCIQEVVAHLESADVVVGFSSSEFDIPAIEGILGRKVAIKDHIDIYGLVREALGERAQQGRAGEYKLGAITKRTLGRGKLENGSYAPDMAFKGEWARLFKYCMDDTRLTRDLFRYIQSEGGIISINRTFLPIKLPEYLRG